MALADNEYGYPVRTTDGKLGLLGDIPPVGADQYCIPYRTTDGRIALGLTEMVDGTDQDCIPARTTDGKIVLMKPIGGTACSDCAGCEDLDGLNITVTFAGLAGDFSVLNGAHSMTIVHDSEAITAEQCMDEITVSGFDIRIWFSAGDGLPACGIAQWIVRITSAQFCTKIFDVVNYPTACHIYGSYGRPANTCNDSDCVDTDSCEDSTGATCVVS